MNKIQINEVLPIPLEEIKPILEKIYQKKNSGIVIPMDCDSEVIICPNCCRKLYTQWIYFEAIPFGNRERLDYEILESLESLERLANRHKMLCKEEKDQFSIINRKEKKCPVCGSPLVGVISKSRTNSLHAGNLRAFDMFYSKNVREIDLLFDELLKEWPPKVDTSLAPDYAESKLRTFDILNSRAKDETKLLDAQSILSNTEQLKKYIHSLLVLESGILSIQKRLKSLYEQRYINDFDVRIINQTPIVETTHRIEKDSQEFVLASQEYQNSLNQLDIHRSARPTPVEIPEPLQPVKPEYKTPGFFNKKKVLAENEALESKYIQELQEYERKSAQRLLDIEKRTKEAEERYQIELQHLEKTAKEKEEKMRSFDVSSKIYTPSSPAEICPEKATQKILAAEIEQTENLLSDMYKARNNMYAANVVFGKYRDIVAIATFYEYLMSGRCTTLEGPSGAYNLYEAEIRADMIISKLSEIEKTLKKIEHSQYMIYSQLTEMNRTLSRIESTMKAAYSAISNIEANTNNMSDYLEKIAKNTSVIAHNTEVSAYYSKLNAELTNALGFMVALK